MRISQSIIARNILYGLNKNREKMSVIQNNIATGKELQKSSDDPVNFSRAARFRKLITQNDQYIKNVIDAQNWIGTTMRLLDELYSGVVKAKNIALQGANDTMNADNRKTLAKQVDSYIEDAVALVNSQYLDKNVFSGTKTKENEPFTYDGTTVSYNGNSGTINRRIGYNLNVSINVTGTQLIDTNIFAALIDLRDDLNANDQDGIQSSIDTIESAVKNMLSLTAAMGSMQKQLSTTTNRLETANINLKSYLSQTEDVDLAEAITKYNSEEMAYRAALQTTTDALRMNLLDFLR